MTGMDRCPGGHPIPPGHVGCSTMGCAYWRSVTADEHDYRAAHGFPRSVSDPSETLALIAEHQITLCPIGGGVWQARASGHIYVAEQPTIGDAVRACVAKIRNP